MDKWVTLCSDDKEKVNAFENEILTYFGIRHKSQMADMTSNFCHQLKANIDSVDLELGPEVVAAIDAVHARYPNPCP